MSVFESGVVALFTLSLVFVVLAVLYTMIMALSSVLNVTAGRKATAVNKVDSAEAMDYSPAADLVQVSSGELKLINVDERTAAMIMAIVSDESQIPLSELCFKSIKAIE